MKVEFTVNGSPVVVEVTPDRRLLDVLREDLHLIGTKEGCGEGECGACAVLLDGTLVHSCLVPAGQLPGTRVLTIEEFATDPAAGQSPADPVQRAFLEEGAVQCGFCTPGMVMATHALLASHPSPDDEAIRAGLSGNICRCTGYERIVRGVRRAAEAMREADAGVATHGKATSGHDDREGSRLPAPRTIAEATAALRTAGEHAAILSGGTDLMLPSSRAALRRGAVIDLSRIGELRGIRVEPDFIEIGATTTVAALAESPILARELPALTEAAGLFGAPAIRNRATIGGNLAGASPAADLPPALLVLESVLVLASEAGVREVRLDAFFTAYRRTARRPDELITAVRIPRTAPATRQAFFKAGTRRAQSIARASVAARARVGSGGTLHDVRLAAGSVAPVPLLLRETMRFLEGAVLDAATIEAAAERASAEITPIDDVRSDEAYRRFVTGRFVARFLRECRTECARPV